MEGKKIWQKTSPHSFDMSEYIFGERFELGGVDFDLTDEPLQPTEAKKPKKLDKPFLFHHGHNEPNT